MNNTKSDALILCGASGDLAYKKIFPALQSMIKRGHLDVPIVGVAMSGWGLDQLRSPAQESLENRRSSAKGGRCHPRIRQGHMGTRRRRSRRFASRRLA